MYCVFITVYTKLHVCQIDLLTRKFSSYRGKKPYVITLHTYICNENCFYSDQLQNIPISHPRHVVDFMFERT